MALIPGIRLGPYEITGQIGVGGMGEVYRAMDTRLKRAVAIKVLPAGLTSDVERLARFHREAEVLASLNHPHIAQIYGLEKSGDITALVMELVEGDDLAQRVARGAIPLDEALPIARQIAEALEAAHEQGIIHRDLKPANIKVRPDGSVKVLDFGLAKALDPASGGLPSVSHSPTITSPAMMTSVGVLLGTAAYMSPEQARGKPVDKRADIWAFGCVLYEMLTGKRAFKGQHVSDILAAILRDEPDGSALPASTPAAVRKLLRRCLEKDRGRRWQSAGDLGLEIEDATGPHVADFATPVPLGRRSVPIWVAAFAGIVLAVAAALVSVWFGSLSGSRELPTVARMVLPLSPGIELQEGPSVVISPDGKQVAYVARRAGISELYLRPIESFQALVIPNTRGASAPFFSPDGQWLGFFADAKLKKVSVSGEVVETLADAGSPGGASVSAVWRPNDTIVFRGPTTIMEIAATRGGARPLLTPEQLRVDGAVSAAEILPGNDALLVTSAKPGGSTDADRSIDVLTTATGHRRVLIQGGTSPRYLPTGHIAFLRNGTLMAVPFDSRRLELAGTPVEVLTGVRQPFNGLGAFSCSRNGTCVYVAGGTVTRRTIALVDRTDAIRPLQVPPKSYGHPRFSPAGDKVSFAIEQIRCEIVVYDLKRTTLTQINSDGDSHFPIWSSDGERIVYLSRGKEPGWELFSQLANGGGTETPLGKSRRNLGPLTSLSLSSAGIVAFADRGDIWLVGPSGDGDPTPFAPSRFNETMPAFSPDGRWIAYVSDESGQLDVYVRPFPGPGEKHRISTDGGAEPVWARSGRELFFRSGNRMMVVDVATTRTFGASRPRLLISAPFGRSQYGYSYDVSPNGQSFVFVNAGEGDNAATQINVLTNWFEEVKRLVPTK